MFNPGYSDTSNYSFQDYEQLYAAARKQLAEGFDQNANYYAAIGRDEISEIFRSLSQTNSKYAQGIKTVSSTPGSNGDILNLGIVTLPNVRSNYEAWAIVVQQ